MKLCVMQRCLGTLPLPSAATNREGRLYIQ